MLTSDCFLRRGVLAGVYLGYATAQYLEFYDFSFFLILGRVTKGAGGDIVIKMAEKVRYSYLPACLPASHWHDIKSASWLLAAGVTVSWLTQHSLTQYGVCAGHSTGHR